MTGPITANSDSPKLPNGRARARDRRHQQLIEATIHAIARYGLSKVTLSRVATAAGQSPSIVNFYFDNKEQLLLATLDFVASEYSREIAKALDRPIAAEAVVAAVKISFDKKICTADKTAVWYAFVSESRARHDYLRICGERDAERSKRLRQLFVGLCGDSGRTEEAARVLAAGLEGMIDKYWEELLFCPEQFNHAAAIADCLDYLRQLFPAQFAAPAPAAEQALGSEEVEKSDLLPAWTYQNQEFFDLEINELFRRNWLLTGHISDIAAVGDYYTFDCFGERLLVVRDRKKQVRAFHNVCRHRGARLVRDDRGNCPRRLTCPFHGWSYGLDGRLNMVPLAKTFPDLNKADIRLATVECEIWHGFIFIRLEGGGASVGEQLRPLEAMVAPYRLEDMQSFQKPCGEDRPYNWKIIHDIDNEGYHVPVGHPGLQSLYGGRYRDFTQDGFPISSGRLRPPGKNDTWSAAMYKKILPEFPHLPADKQNCWNYVGIFPSMVLAFYPDMVEFYMTLPQTPRQTRYYAGSYALPDKRRAARLARYLNRRINSETDSEDASFVNWMQSGLSSSAFPQFTLSTIEQGVRDFHKKIQNSLPVAEMSSEPAFGGVAVANKNLRAQNKPPASGCINI